MQDFLAAITLNPELPSFLLGVGVPYLYRFLDVIGQKATTRQKFGLNVALCTAAALIPVYAKWYFHGLPEATEFLSSLSSAFAASEGFYRLYFKPKAEAAA